MRHQAISKHEADVLKIQPAGPTNYKKLLAHYTRIQVYRVAQSMKEHRLWVSDSQEPKIIF